MKKRVLEDVAQKYAGAIYQGASAECDKESDEANIFMDAYRVWNFAVQFYGNKHSKIETFLTWAVPNFGFLFNDIVFNF